MQFWHKILTKNAAIGFCCLAFNTLCFASTSEGIQTYQKTSPLHQQKIAADIDRYYNADDLWHVLRQEFTLPHYEDNPIVQEKIQWFLNHQDYLMHSMTRAGPYLYFILQQIRKRHLPAELVLLPIIESAYNPFALNASSGAAGIWQMMPNTASGYGIRQNWWYDGRRDVVASTKAALNHLAYLQTFFEGNWLLAIAAYDTGEGNVLSAIRKNINNGENTDFWSLPVAAETRDYVPRLLALAAIISRPDDYPILLPAVRNAPYLAQIDVGGQIDLKAAAYLAGLSLKDLKRLNPGYNRASTDPHGPFKLVLPIEHVAQFTENLSSSSFRSRVKWARYKQRPDDEIMTVAKRSSKKRMIAQKNHLNSNALRLEVSNTFKNVDEHYQMQPGDTLYMVRPDDDIEKIARRFHTTTDVLAMVNHTNNHALQPGDKLIIPTHPAETEQHYQLTPGDTIYMVRRGDTIEKIADRFHTTPEAVRLANLLASNKLEVGDQLVIPTHV